MDTQKSNDLNLLINKRNNLIIEQKLSQKRPWTSKQIGLYIFGLYGVTIVCAIASISIPIIPAIYALLTPMIIINKNKKKSKELEIEINNLNIKIYEIEEDLKKETELNKQYDKVNDNNIINMTHTSEILEPPFFETTVTEDINLSSEDDGPKLVKSIFSKNPKKM